ncbi:MAG: cytochrome c biogenesis protein CcsA [Planctomycetes bacterium]|nr:cytochrome c biogenesis protein CcsA [Planctomycetota bacterium]
MATSELPRPEAAAIDTTQAAGIVMLSAERSCLARGLNAFASLRLTVLLFAIAIFLVFAGTLAQVDQGIWRVVNDTYFRVWFARIDFVVFERLAQLLFKGYHGDFSGGFYFPGGKLIGLLLLLNLTAAHAVRFKIATAGTRLWIGLAIIALGILITFLVIQSGMDEAVESELSPALANGLWQSLRATLVLAVLAGTWFLVDGFHRLRRTEWLTLLAIDLLFAVLTVWLFANPDARLDDAGLRILWQLVKGTAAGIVLLIGCVLVFRKRAGIVLVHGGVALMMLSELVTGMSAHESQMTISEGATVNWSQDVRASELAVTDRSDPEEDRETVVPESLLAASASGSTRIDHSDLPFSLQVRRWLPNSHLVQPVANAPNPATAGFGREQIAEPLQELSGVDMENRIDFPSAYVELLSKKDGSSLGTYLLSQWLDNQKMEVDGRTYDLALRFQRIYYPYTLTLKDFRFDRYIGTNTAKNYSSLVQLKDPARNVDREIAIWMNNPLRYAGTTFYQSSFDGDTELTTVLQVVKNPGWMAPYVACMLVATGMLAHFGSMLVRFLRRRAEEEIGATQLKQVGQSGKANRVRQPATRLGAWAAFAKWFPAIVLILFAGYVLSKTRMPKSAPSEMQIHEFAELPLAYQGRIKPYDTVARNSLQILSGRQELIVEKDGVTTRLPAIRWLLDVISGAPAANDHRVFRIESLDLLDTLGLKPREGSFRYSFNEIHDKQGELDKQIQLAAAQPEDGRSLYQRQVLELAKKRQLFVLLTVSFRSPPISSEQDSIQASLQQVQQLIAELRASEAPHAVPPKVAGERWMPLLEAEFEALRDQVTGRQVNRSAAALRSALKAYADGDVTSFNRELATYRQAMSNYEKSLDADKKQLVASGLAKAEILSRPKVDFEVFYNQFSPFYYAAVLYLVAFVLGVLSWLGWTEPLRRGSIWLLWFTFVVHTFALVARIYISGRPPVTNLYSSAVFIGWACVLLALVFESLYRLGIGNIVAAVLGFLTLLVAHFLSLDGDTFIVLQAVLDTQFWLATHVVCITLGYSTTFLAGMLGIMYVLLAHLFPVLDDTARRQLTRMIYGTLCFAIFFSFIGTVLGGLWADDSWGRFWGWDPKENGALIIVLYNALVLHARWGGLVKGRGLALLAIGGNIVTTWSWFGVNELGVGLHSYGASESTTAMWLLTFAASQLALIGLGAMPKRWFASMVPGRAATTNG